MSKGEHSHKSSFRAAASSSDRSLVQSQRGRKRAAACYCTGTRSKPQLWSAAEEHHHKTQRPQKGGRRRKEDGRMRRARLLRWCSQPAGEQTVHYIIKQISNAAASYDFTGQFLLHCKDVLKQWFWEIRLQTKLLLLHGIMYCTVPALQQYYSTNNIRHLTLADYISFGYIIFSSQ